MDTESRLKMIKRVGEAWAAALDDMCQRCPEHEKLCKICLWELLEVVDGRRDA